MKKKKWVIPIVIIAVIIMLWFTGIIPKQIAKISGTSYVNKVEIHLAPFAMLRIPSNRREVWRISLYQHKR